MFTSFTNAAYIFTLAIQHSWIVEVVAGVRGRCLVSDHHRAIFQSPLHNISDFVPLYDVDNNGPIRSLSRGLGDVSGSVGLGDFVDLMYTVPIQLGRSMFALQLDTGSSDLWVLSNKCRKNSCKNANVTRYPSSSFASTGVDVDMFYGDSSTGSFASGTVGLDTATIAGVTIAQQPFALIDDTTNNIVESNAPTSGILGLSFPTASRIQEEVTAKMGPLVQTDTFLEATDSSGPLLSRLAASGALDMPMFTIESQRTAIDISGRGLFTVGNLPDDVDNSTLTWVPVRLYTVEEGGLIAPSFAPGEIYPYRWEIDIDGVFLDGKRLPDSTISADGVDSQRVSALIDTGNSVLRGPEDVVNNILGSVSDTYDPTSQNPIAALPCNVPHSLAFQIGGKMFPIDPRDFISQLDSGNAVTCQADNIVTTDAPAVGSLFRWSFGTPFFRSNIVAFYFGNLTHPSVDPPRIGLRSTVPENANELLQEAVRKATLNGGNFPNAVELAPTGSAALQPHTSVPTSAQYLAIPTKTSPRTSSNTSLSGPTTDTQKIANAGVGMIVASAPSYLFNCLLKPLILLSFCL